ncbi:unnamed protein product [Musa textilis]
MEILRLYKVKLYNLRGHEFGVDFITSNQVKEIDFTTFHAYPDMWHREQSEEARKMFLQKWISSHWDDSVKVLGEPLVFGEFEKAKTAPEYSQKVHDDFFSDVYDVIYNDAETNRGSFSGGLLWYIMGDGIKSYYDEYKIVLSQDLIMTTVIKK